MQQAVEKQEVTEIVINKPFSLMDDLERIEYLADELDGYMPCPYPRMKLLAWVAAELATGKHTGTGAGASLDNAYEDWISKMHTKTIDQKAIAMLVATGGLRELRAVREGDAWALQGRIGQDWLPVRSLRQELRLWRSLTAVERFCTAAGVKQLLVEL